MLRTQCVLLFTWNQPVGGLSQLVPAVGQYGDKGKILSLLPQN